MCGRRIVPTNVRILWIWIRVHIKVIDDQKIISFPIEKILFIMFLYKNRIYLFQPSIKHVCTSKWEISSFFLYFLVIFAFLDLDPQTQSTQLNPDLIRFGTMVWKVPADKDKKSMVNTTCSHVKKRINFFSYLLASRFAGNRDSVLLRYTNLYIF